MCRVAEQRVLDLPLQEIDNPLEVAATSVRYLVNAEGNRTDVVLPLPTWESLLIWLEEADDRAIVREWLPRLKAGPVASGALQWDELAAEWEDDTAV